MSKAISHLHEKFKHEYQNTKEFNYLKLNWLIFPYIQTHTHTYIHTYIHRHNPTTYMNNEVLGLIDH